MWLDEKINKSAKFPEFSICCAKGKVILPPLQKLPSPLDILLTGNDSRSRLFKQNIQMYNSVLSFTSIGVNVNQEVTGTSGVYTFRIHGEMYHRIGTLLPNSETPLSLLRYIFMILIMNYKIDQVQRLILILILLFLQNYNKCYMILTHMLIYFGKLEIC